MDLKRCNLSNGILGYSDGEKILLSRENFLGFYDFRSPVESFSPSELPCDSMYACRTVVPTYGAIHRLSMPYKAGSGFVYKIGSNLYGFSFQSNSSFNIPSLIPTADWLKDDNIKIYRNEEGRLLSKNLIDAKQLAEESNVFGWNPSNYTISMGGKTVSLGVIVHGGTWHTDGYQCLIRYFNGFYMSYNIHTGLVSMMVLSKGSTSSFCYNKSDTILSAFERRGFKFTGKSFDYENYSPLFVSYSNKVCEFFMTNKPFVLHNLHVCEDTVFTCVGNAIKFASKSISGTCPIDGTQVYQSYSFKDKQTFAFEGIKEDGSFSCEFSDGIGNGCKYVPVVALNHSDLSVTDTAKKFIQAVKDEQIIFPMPNIGSHCKMTKEAVENARIAKMRKDFQFRAEEPDVRPGTKHSVLPEDPSRKKIEGVFNLPPKPWEITIRDIRVNTIAGNFEMAVPVSNSNVFVGQEGYENVHENTNLDEIKVDINPGFIDFDLDDDVFYSPVNSQPGTPFYSQTNSPISSPRHSMSENSDEPTFFCVEVSEEENDQIRHEVTNRDRDEKFPEMNNDRSEDVESGKSPDTGDDRSNAKPPDIESYKSATTDDDRSNAKPPDIESYKSATMNSDQIRDKDIESDKFPKTDTGHDRYENIESKESAKSEPKPPDIESEESARMGSSHENIENKESAKMGSDQTRYENIESEESAKSVDKKKYKPKITKFIPFTNNRFDIKSIPHTNPETKPFIPQGNSGNKPNPFMVKPKAGNNLFTTGSLKPVNIPIFTNKSIISNPFMPKADIKPNIIAKQFNPYPLNRFSPKVF